MSDLRVSEGETAVVRCMAQGSPFPHIDWNKDGDALELTDRHFFTANNQLLVIVEATTSDAGQYACTMSNALGMQYDVMTLHVAVAPPGDEIWTTGVIVIAVVCCVVLTSLIWVVFIFYNRRCAKAARARACDGSAERDVMARGLPGDEKGASESLLQRQ